MKKVLIVEDYADIRRLIRMTLELEDFEIHEAHTGASGLAAVHQLRPDVVLLDVMMPGELDGIDVCRQIKADPLLAATRVILLTARGGHRQVQQGLAAGADAYLVKPFSPLKLIDVICRDATAVTPV